MEDFRKAILEFAESSKKTKFYFKDMDKAVKKVFPDAKSSMDYYKGLLADLTVYAEFDETDFRHFVISKANFAIFFKNKNVFNYIRFFNEHYLPNGN